MARDAEQWEVVEEATELLLEGKTQEAIVALREVLRRNSKNAYAFFYLATALFELEEWEPARDAYKAAMALSPGYRGARVGLAHAHLQLEAFKDALSVSRALLRDFPDDADAMYAVAMALAAQGKRAASTKMLQRFLDTNPDLEAQLEARGVIEMLAKGDEGDPLKVV